MGGFLNHCGGNPHTKYLMHIYESDSYFYIRNLLKELLEAGFEYIITIEFVLSCCKLRKRLLSSQKTGVRMNVFWFTKQAFGSVKI